MIAHPHRNRKSSKVACLRQGPCRLNSRKELTDTRQASRGAKMTYNNIDAMRIFDAISTRPAPLLNPATPSRIIMSVLMITQHASQEKEESVFTTHLLPRPCLEGYFTQLTRWFAVFQPCWRIRRTNATDIKSDFSPLHKRSVVFEAGKWSS